MTLPTPNKQARKITRWSLLTGWGVLIAITIGLAWYGRLPGIPATSIQTPSKTAVTWLIKRFVPEADTQKFAAILPGLELAPVLSISPGNSVIPTAQTPVATNQPELVTVITMTPTMPGGSYPIQGGNEVARSTVDDLNPEAVQLKGLIQDLISRMQVTLIQIETVGHTEPTVAEMTAFRSKVNEFSANVQEIQKRFESIQAGNFAESAFTHPQITKTPDPTQAPLADTTLLNQFSNLQAQMIEMQQILAAMGGNQDVSPSERSTGAADFFPSSTPAAPMAGSTPADPHDHSTPPNSADSGAAGGLPSTASGMAMMPCMGDQNSQASGASPVITNGPLARTVQTASFSLTFVPLTIRGAAETTIDFYIVVDSSNGELRPDLARNIGLRLPDGNAVPVREWTGPVSGSHLEGTLSFAREDMAGNLVSIPYQGSLSLDIGGLTGINSQVISWDLRTIP